MSFIPKKINLYLLNFKQREKFKIMFLTLCFEILNLIIKFKVNRKDKKIQKKRQQYIINTIIKL